MKLEEIAKLAGVSKATVSSVLNGKATKYRISADTQARVLAIVEQYGYQPNYSAAALRRGSSNSIGFIVPDFENRSYLRIAKRLEALARSAGYQLIISSSDDNPQTELQAAKVLVARGVDALLVSSSLDNEASVYLDILQRGTPVIALDRPLPENFCNIISDDRQGAFELTRSLALDDIRHIALFGAMKDLQVSRLREQGFMEAARQSPHVRAHCFYGPHFDAETGATLLQQTQQQLGHLPDAIITTSFSLLEGVIEGLQTHPDGNQVYTDSPIQLATFGNSRLLDFLPLTVNSLPQQYELIAESAWKLAKQSIDHQYQPQQVVVNRVLRKRNILSNIEY
ncbi:catabolite repressor/activator [Gynuella sp.]|uniref:catabolite repressor/activator n=1 Tax=Gynuella sp. TaxID=2969146 RepID=UPI003D138B36